MAGTRLPPPARQFRFEVHRTNVRGGWRNTIEEAIRDGVLHAAGPDVPPEQVKTLWAPLMFNPDGSDRYVIRERRAPPT